MISSTNHLAQQPQSTTTSSSTTTHNRQSSHHQNQFHFIQQLSSSSAATNVSTSFNNHNDPTATTAAVSTIATITTSSIGNHNRHHSLNSINMAQLMSHSATTTLPSTTITNFNQSSSSKTSMIMSNDPISTTTMPSNAHQNGHYRQHSYHSSHHYNQLLNGNIQPTLSSTNTSNNHKCFSCNCGDSGHFSSMSSTTISNTTNSSSHSLSGTTTTAAILFEPELMAIAIYNFRPSNDQDNHSSSGSSKRSSTASSLLTTNCDSISINSSVSLNSSSMRHNYQHNASKRKYLPLCLGDVLVVVERHGQWFRGFREQDPHTMGFFPSNYVQVFDDNRRFRSGTCDTNNNTFYYYTLLDPLYLQVVRTLREWHHHLVSHYRTNVNMEKFLIVRNLIYELLELSSTLNKDLAPSLWRRRSSQLLKINSDPKDPFAKLYVGEEDPNGNKDGDKDELDSKSDPVEHQKINSTNCSMFDSSLEDLYERILSKLNQGNQHLNLDIMPSFTHGTFNNIPPQRGKDTINTRLMNNVITNKNGTIKKRTKFSPYFIKDNCKYLTYILDYYNHINRGFNQKFKSNITTTAATTNHHSAVNHRHSFSSYISPSSNLLTGTTNTSATTGVPASSTSTSGLIRKFRRHLLFMVREANFSNLHGNASGDHLDHSLQIDFYILRCNDSNSSGVSSGSCASSESCSPYEVLTEKYCYRVNLNNHHHNKHNVSRALFLDVLSKRSQTGSTHHHHHFQSQQSDASNYYLIIQVWRNGKMLLNESRTKNMLSATSSLTTGSSVFHTISSATISSAAVAATSNSLSSLTSFVSNSSLFNNSSATMTDKSNSSGTPDSSSIDSSEFGSSYFKRSVGFAVIPLLELVSQDKEIRPSVELFQNENFLPKILFSDESKLFPFPVKLYEGDLTVSILETMLKHRQALSTISSQSSSSSSSSSISKLSPLATNSYQLVICAKFISELMIQNPHQSAGKRLSNGSFAPQFMNSLDNTSNSNSQMLPPLSLADHLLMMGQNSQLVTNNHQTANTVASTGNSQNVFHGHGNQNFVLVQKRCFGDLMTAGYIRNDLYLTLECAEFEKGGKTIPKNIEVSVCLISENGVQERAIQSGVNMDPVTIYRSHIQYHQNSPKWFEHLKVNVPLEQFETAHLRFTFCHCSSKERERKFIGFSYLPLADQQGACLPDGLHELHIYKCDSDRKLDDVVFYLSVPWGPNQKAASISSTPNSSLINSRSAKEVFHVKSTLISSKLTQNSDILSLLKWSCTPLTQVYDSLQRLSRVPGEEMVKFLEDILDALFALFTTTTISTGENNSEANQHQITLIFRVIVDFFKTLNDPKFLSYRSALEKYIEKQFSAPLVYSGLIRCVKKYIELVIISVQQQSETNGSVSGVTKRELEFILRCLSVFDWILKIIVQSRILYTRAATSGNLIILDSSSDKPTEIQTDDEFKNELLSLFSSINRLLSVECKSSDDYLIVAIQESVLSSLPQAFGYLSQILRPLEMAKLVQSLVHLNNGQNNSNSSYQQHRHSIHNDFSPLSPSSSITPTNSSTPTTTTSCSTTKKTIINAKLALLQHAIQFRYVWQEDEEARMELLDIFIRMLNICISESKHCLHILRDIILYLIDNALTLHCCKVRIHPNRIQKRPTLSHVREREIELLSFGAIDAIVEHIIELTGVVPTSFGDLFAPFTTMPFKIATTLGGGLPIGGNDDGDYLGTMIICLMVLLDFMSLKHYEKLFEKRSTSNCKELILNIFAVFLNALYYFPDNWLEIKMAVNRIILHSLTMLRTIMSVKFLGADRFDETIWRMYFKLAIAFLTQQRLQLESQQYWKRCFLLDVYGCDMRILMGFELVACWDLIGPFKINFIPSLVSSFVDVTLVPELELRKATIPIFYDMLMVDYMANANFKQVEASLIDKLDVIAHKTECDMQFKELFTQILTDKIESLKPVWNVDGLKLVQSISRLLALLIDYRNELKRKLASSSSSSSSSSTNNKTSTTVTSTSSANTGSSEVDNRLLICTYTLLKFFRDDVDSATNRKTIMLRYLEKLANVHTMLGNYAEAAFTLKLQADQLSWSTAHESQKKESLCQAMLNYFEKGQCWEEGIKVCKDLQQVYERSYKYAKLSAILKRNADLLDKILTQHRPDNEYFRVSFYGLDFPSFLQNSTFIFRGLEFEKISSFTHRIQQEFPNAQLLTKIIPTDENITEAKCQYIQIFSVKPIPEPPVSPDQTLIFGTPDNVLNYYNTNSVRQFIQDRPIQKAPFDPNNEFKSLWIERTTYVTEQPLPGMLRMFKVISTLVTYLSPIENACETIENKNSELSKLIATYSNEATRPESISPLTMRLQGILDAAVNGGIAKYIDAFLGSEFLSANPEQVSNVSRLKDRIAHQIQIVEAGLTLHGHLAPTPVRPLHTRLLERFAIMRNTVHQANIETSQALLWVPNSSSTNSSFHQGQCHQRPSILSQPLPPIPSQQRQHHDNLSISDPSSSDTSSLSSTSSSQINMLMMNNHCATNNDRSLRTPPPSQPPPPPPYNTQSPGSKSLKNKPLPPLPPAMENQQPLLIKRHNSNIEHRSRPGILRPGIESDSIYSVPQYTDLNDLSHLPDNESSVDDSMDYCDVHFMEPSVTNGSSVDMVDGNFANNQNRINRSLSIPCSAMSLYLGTANGDSSKTTTTVAIADATPTIPPPPLPPRATSSSTLDRSNSLNRHQPPIQPPPPPALPQRPLRNKQQQQLNGTILTTKICTNPTPTTTTTITTTVHFTPLDGLEFENLLLSSPTPVTQPSTRPGPIIGIEINNNNNNVTNHNNQNDITDNNLSTIVPTTILAAEQHRAKSNSLPRSLSQQFQNFTNGNNNNNGFDYELTNNGQDVSDTLDVQSPNNNSTGAASISSNLVNVGQPSPTSTNVSITATTGMTVTANPATVNDNETSTCIITSSLLID